MMDRPHLISRNDYMNLKSYLDNGYQMIVKKNNRHEYSLFKKGYKERIDLVFDSSIEPMQSGMYIEDLLNDCIIKEDIYKNDVCSFK